MNRAKIILLSIAGILIIIVVISIIHISNKNKTPDGEVTHSSNMTDIKDNFTYKEYAARNEDKKVDTTAPVYSITTDQLNTPPVQQVTPQPADETASPEATQSPQAQKSLAEIRAIKASLNTPPPVAVPSDPDLNAYMNAQNTQPYQAQLSSTHHEVTTETASKQETAVKKDVWNDHWENTSPQSTASANSSSAMTKVSLHAAILKSVEVKDGQTVDLKILESKTVLGIPIKKGAVMTGIISLNRNRVYITVEGSNVSNTLNDLNFVAYDNKGIAGLKVVGVNASEAGDVARDQGVSTASGAIPSDRYGVINGAKSVIQAFATRRDNKIFLPTSVILLKSIAINN